MSKATTTAIFRSGFPPTAHLTHRQVERTGSARSPATTHCASRNQTRLARSHSLRRRGISTFPYAFRDWYDNAPTNPPPGIAISGLNRVVRSTGTSSSFDLSLNPTPTFAIYYSDINLIGDANYQAGSFIDSLTLQWPGSANIPFLTLNVMGLSGSTTVPEPSSLLLLTAAAGVWLVRRPLGRVRL